MKTPHVSIKLTGPILIFLGLIVALTGCSTTTSAGKTDRSHIQRLVAREAVNLGIPVPLALAVAHAESNFNPQALSHKGARGVMQIMPATARGEYGIEKDMLWNPRVNIRIGLHFLGRLIDRYKGRTDLALSYYNGGSRVGTLPSARVIPATRKYVKRVQRLRRKYSRTIHTLNLATSKGDSYVL
ncbi:MAG: lytic transglycosylase domain-containing protein [Pseudomonas marincola]